MGGFAEQAPTAVADSDAGWAHSAWLQQAAETGLPGGVLLLALGLVAVLGAGRASRRASPSLAGVTVAAVLVQASIDYVLHFSAVAVLTSLFAGMASTSSVREARPDDRGFV